MTICLNDSDDEKILTEIPIWNSNFYEYCKIIFYPFLRPSKKCNVITTLNSEVLILQKKGFRNALLKVYNPIYCIIYKNIPIANIIVDVAGWDTYYDIDWYMDQNYMKIICMLGTRLPNNVLYSIMNYLHNPNSVHCNFQKDIN
jgi:hypothetical protein